MTRWVLGLGVVIVVGVLAIAVGVERTRPAPPATLEGRVLAVERQLLCPQCTNQRLDVCDTAICQDMRREIRARLERGEADADIVRFFAGRYGDRVLASVPKSGFNLWLWGWVLGVIVLVGGAGAWWLSRRAPSREAPPLEDQDERWLDAQLRDEPASGAGR